MLSGSRVFLGTQNGSYVVALDSHEPIDLGQGGTWAAYHAPTERLVTLGYVFNLFDLARGRLVTQWSASVGEIDCGPCLALGPDGTLAATGTMQGNVVLWDVGSRRGLPKGPKGDGKGVTTRAPEGKPLRVLHGGKQFVEWLSFSPDGQSLAVGDYAGDVRVFAVKSGRVTRTIKRGGASAGAFSPDGEHLATADSSDVVVVWDAKGRVVRRWKAGRALCFVNADVLAILGPGELALWNPMTGKKLASAKTLKANGRAASVSSFGSLLVTTGPVGLFSIS